MWHIWGQNASELQRKTEGTPKLKTGTRLFSSTKVSLLRSESITSHTHSCILPIDNCADPLVLSVSEARSTWSQRVPKCDCPHPSSWRTVIGVCLLSFPSLLCRWVVKSAIAVSWLVWLLCLLQQMSGLSKKRKSESRQEACARAHAHTCN